MLNVTQVPGKKNLVLQKSLVGPVEALVKFSTLQEWGVDRIFFLENDNVDASQQNVIFVACGEKGKQAYSIACKYVCSAKKELICAKGQLTLPL